MKTVLQELRTYALSVRDLIDGVRWEAETLEKQLIVDEKDIYDVANTSQMEARLQKMFVQLYKFQAIAELTQKELTCYKVKEETIEAI